jgi:hypothetical protein
MTLNVHATQAERYLQMGYVVVEQNGSRVDMLDSEFSCLRETVNGLCRLDKGHKGHHSVKVFTCDHCDKTRRGRPHRISYGGATLCVFCVKELS